MTLLSSLPSPTPYACGALALPLLVLYRTQSSLAGPPSLPSSSSVAAYTSAAPFPLSTTTSPLPHRHHNSDFFHASLPTNLSTEQPPTHIPSATTINAAFQHTAAAISSHVSLPFNLGNDCRSLDDLILTASQHHRISWPSAQQQSIPVEINNQQIPSQQPSSTQ
ncbi:hypothetical protein BHE74_00015565 [Ensete ventricosum]|nr:hypothetical protein BHE74_00015565 [Ensete ventricosum]